MVQCLKIADLTYQLPATLKLSENYLPFIVSGDERMQIHSEISIRDIKVSDKEICHQGLVIDDTKELSIYKERGGAYYITINNKGEKEKYELYATPTWNHVELSMNCIGPNCSIGILDLFMMLTFIYSAANYNTVLLHSSTVKCGDNAVAFIGQSGAGKSTHSRLWLKYIPNTILLNDDQPAVRVHDSGEIKIYGTPWSGKTPCYKFDSGLLCGIVRMKQAPFNEITALSPVALFQELLASCSMIKEDVSTFKLITYTLSRIASRISGFVLKNRPEKEAAIMTYMKTIEVKL